MKHRIYLVAVGSMLALLAPDIAAAQQRHSTEWRTKPKESRRYASTDASRRFVDYARCVTDRRYSRAREVVLAPFASAEQAAAANKVVRSDDDGCLRGGFDDVRMTFRPEALAGGLAQALIIREYPDLPVVLARYTSEPAAEQALFVQMNPNEIYGRCVVQRDPAAAFALFQSRPASVEEEQAVAGLRDDLSPCLAAGSRIEITPMFLRNVMGVAAYRLAQQVEARTGNVSGN